MSRPSCWPSSWRATDARLVTVVGRGGVGKTAMVCRLLKGLESGSAARRAGVELARGRHRLPAHPERASGELSRTCSPTCAGCCPAETADRLVQRYQDPHETPAGLMAALLEEFPAEQTVVVLLDNFEDLLDADTGAITEAALDEALRALLSAPAHGVKVVITTRVAPQIAAAAPAGRAAADRPGRGAAVAVRRAGAAGAGPGRQARAEEPPRTRCWRLARERTRGYPAGAWRRWRRSCRRTATPACPNCSPRPSGCPRTWSQALVGEAFQRLDPLAQQVMQALAIYPVPVPAVAVDYLLQPYQPAINAAPVLARLVNMQFVRRDAGHYYLHQVDRDYALGRIPDGAARRPRRRPAAVHPHALRDRGADYFTQTRTPREEWKTLDDLAPQLAEFELRCQGGDYDTAAQVLLAIDFDYLIPWGHYRYTIDLHTRLHGHLTDPRTRAASTASLGTLPLPLGDYPRAIELYEQALTIDREIGDREGEAAALGNLGNCYADLGQTRAGDRAVRAGPDHLPGDRRPGRRSQRPGQPRQPATPTLGQTQRAIDLHEQALTIDRETGDREGEATAPGQPRQLLRRPRPDPAGDRAV